MNPGFSSRMWTVAKWSYALMAAVTIFSAWLNVRDALFTVHQPYQVEYGEGPILFHALRLVQHQPLYPAPQELPSIFAPYGPVVYGLTALCIRWFGISFVAPRALALGCAVGVAILLGLLIRRLTRSWLLALAFGPMFLCMLLTQAWMGLLRVDVIGLFLTLAGFCVFVAWPRLWVPAVALMAAAVFCKMTLLSAPAACVLWLLLARDWRRAIRVGGLFAALVAAGMLALQIASGGQFFIHTFKSFAGEFTWRQYRDVMAGVLHREAYLPLLALPSLLFLRGKDERRLAVLYVCLATLAINTVGKGGATDNHLIEWTALLCLAGALTSHYLLERQAWSYAGLALFVLIPAMLSLYAVNWSESTFRNERGCSAAAAYLRSRGDMLLSENVGLLVLAGKPVLLSDPFISTQLSVYRHWPEQKMLSALREGSVDAVLTSCDFQKCWNNERWSPAVVQAIQQNYRMARRFQCADAAFVYEPLARPEAATPAQ